MPEKFQRLSPDLAVGDLVDTNGGWRGRITQIDPRANKWPYTAKSLSGPNEDLFAAFELQKVKEEEEEVHPGEVLDALKVVNLEIQATEEKLRGLKKVRKVLEANQLRDLLKS